jgi:hypothetical protein
MALTLTDISLVQYYRVDPGSWYLALNTNQEISLDGQGANPTH